MPSTAALQFLRGGTEAVAQQRELLPGNEQEWVANCWQRWQHGVYMVLELLLPPSSSYATMLDTRAEIEALLRCGSSRCCSSCRQHCSY